MRIELECNLGQGHERSSRTPVAFPVEYYNLFRNRIEHEDNLIVQRLSWLVASQSFLFTAYAITVNGLSSLPPSVASLLVTQERLFFRLIPAIGILTQ